MIFLTVFIAGMVYAYRSDAAVNREQYGSNYGLFLGIIFFLLLLYLFVKYF
ncbi:MAG: hypothetical protein N3F09_05635 [Bacteroidia bacterium]|nr:hypothetical protein [Bacteroidia bacterium]